MIDIRNRYVLTFSQSGCVVEVPQSHHRSKQLNLISKTSSCVTNINNRHAVLSPVRGKRKHYKSVNHIMHNRTGHDSQGSDNMFIEILYVLILYSLECKEQKHGPLSMRGQCSQDNRFMETRGSNGGSSLGPQCNELVSCEAWRLAFYRKNQDKIRQELYRGITDAISQGRTEGSSTGKRIILPASFTGGARYMMQNYQDAMAICKWAGYPDIFITFTCNPKWPEITRYLIQRSLKVEDRPDIVARIFRMKLRRLLKLLKDGKVFGPCKAVVYTIEFQKRGLPHAHILVFLHEDAKHPHPEDIDQIISAEIPDPNDKPGLYEAVKEFMLHGPCGTANRNSPCMVDGRCSKFFPKKFEEETKVNEDGYPVYRRRDTGHTIEKGAFIYDNRDVVPFNETLLEKFQSHINTEWCNQSRSIKYLFKYISKGTDRITAALYRQANDESVQLQPHEIQNLGLREIERILRTSGRSLADFASMPQPEREGTTRLTNSLIAEQLNFNHEQQDSEFRMLEASMTDEQKLVFESIMSAIMSGRGAESRKKRKFATDIYLCILRYLLKKTLSMANQQFMNMPSLFHHPVVVESSLQRFRVEVPGWNGILYPGMANIVGYMEDDVSDEEEEDVEEPLGGVDATQVSAVSGGSIAAN
ncbi:hypothetical protein RIF29_26474 [Crotalaria pallida]|uniref:Helitron helicase-like domain-containing protein n=1 Tax=Crotalaria pallida TaxID=3830 RepID=A0AAN9HZW2_CROPI